jgi:ribonuclease P protein component
MAASLPGLVPHEPILIVRAPSLKAADFQRALGSRPVARTAHFVLHTLPVSGKVPSKAEGPTSVSAASATHLPAQLSTGEPASLAEGVEDQADISPSPDPGVWRLGLVLPKKQARRSVTRSLIRHQAREALRRHAPAVRAQGRFGPEVDGWVLRLKTPFDRQQYPSAASKALQLAVRLELDELWARLAPPAPGRGTA